MYSTLYIPSLKLYKPTTRGLQRDVVYLGWPMAPSYMYEPKCGGSGELRGLSQWVQLYTGPNSKFNLCLPHPKKLKNGKYKYLPPHLHLSTALSFILHIIQTVLKQIQPCCIFSLWSPCIMYTVYSQSVPVLNCILHYNKFFNASWHTVKKLNRKSEGIGSKVIYREPIFLNMTEKFALHLSVHTVYWPWSSQKFLRIEYDDFFDSVSILPRSYHRDTVYKSVPRRLYFPALQ